jgi:hypothetical protein
MKRAFIIGNGESRKDFDLEKLRAHGKIYGCNALYRDFTPDVLVAVDHGIMHEIYHSGYAFNNECWFRNWRHIRKDLYRHHFFGANSKITNEEFKKIKKYFKNVKENERGNSEYFTCHGTPIQNVLRQLNKDLTNFDTINLDKNFFQKSKILNLCISWIKEDKAKTLEDVMENGKDNGWSSGSTAGMIACLQEKPDEIYMIGMDFKSNSKKVNNLYAGTENYVPKTNSPIPSQNWIIQWKKLYELNPNTKFFKVNKSTEPSKINNPIEEWKNIKNIIYTTYDKCFFNR